MKSGWDRRVIAELHHNVSDVKVLKHILESMGWAKAYKYTYYKSKARF